MANTILKNWDFIKPKPTYDVIKYFKDGWTHLLFEIIRKLWQISVYENIKWGCWEN